MKLGNRNLVYSLLLAVIMLLGIIGYFVLMFPSLYVDYMNEQNLKAVQKQHEEFVKTGTYEELEVKNPTACFSLKVPQKGNDFYVSMKAGTVKITITDAELAELLQEMQDMMKNYAGKKEEWQNEEWNEAFNDKVEQMKKALEKTNLKEVDLPFSIKVLQKQTLLEDYCGEYEKMHCISENLMIMETGVSDGENQYTTYIALGKEEESFVVSFLPVVTPQMNEVTPIIMQSLPMICMVILLLVLLFSQVYSKGIVAPIVTLGKHAGQMKGDGSVVVTSLRERGFNRPDEIGDLAVTIDTLYEEVQASYLALKEKNEKLQEENKRQEIFMRASSHQLKTPIAAALLLLDGMMNQIGKYKDTQKYLPKVKEQMLYMRKMVEDILSLNHMNGVVKKEPCCLDEFVKVSLQSYHVLMAKRKISTSIEGEQEVVIKTDSEMLLKIVDNAISNAVKYTPEGERIEIYIDQNTLQIRNYGAKIPQDLLQHICDPFVKGNHETNSHGLGLYIAAYYARQLGIGMDVKNEEHNVCFTISF